MFAVAKVPPTSVIFAEIFMNSFILGEVLFIDTLTIGGSVS